MPAKVYHLDANVVLRFLRNDHADYSPRARKFIDQANAGKIVLEVTAVTVAEIFYALRVSYHVDRRTAARTLGAVLNTPAFRLIERDLLLGTLARVESANVDFGDAYLAALAANSRNEIASFDGDLDRFTDIKRHEP